MTNASGYKSDTPPATAVEHTSIDTFTQMIEIAVFDASPAAGDPVTIFAPADSAFADLSDEQKTLLLDPENKEELAYFLSNHMAVGLSNPTLRGAPMFLDTLG